MKWICERYALCPRVCVSYTVQWSCLAHAFVAQYKKNYQRLRFSTSSMTLQPPNGLLQNKKRRWIRNTTSFRFNPFFDETRCPRVRYLRTAFCTCARCARCALIQRLYWIDSFSVFLPLHCARCRRLAYSWTHACAIDNFPVSAEYLSWCSGCRWTRLGLTATVFTSCTWLFWIFQGICSFSRV